MVILSILVMAVLAVAILLLTSEEDAGKNRGNRHCENEADTANKGADYFFGDKFEIEDVCEFLRFIEKEEE